jgi:Holliday junction DNA helicase RuvB
MLGVDELGLTPSDRSILETIIVKYKGGPVGLNTIAASLSEEQATVEEYNEPYLIQTAMIERTSRGRQATDLAYKHLNIPNPKTEQKKLL